MELLNLTNHDGGPMEASEGPEAQQADPKTAHWLNVITILNFMVAACLVVLATARLAKLISPATAFGAEWILSVPLRPFSWLIFSYTNEPVLAQIAIGCLVGLATAGAFGLRRRLNW